MKRSDHPHLRLVEAGEVRPGPIRSRTLDRPGGGPALEFLEAKPERPSGPPILFVHGAFGGAWVWSEIFMPHLARRGSHVAAVSLRGHGRSEGQGRLQEWRLSDCVADIRRACEEFSEPPLIVGHSLGGLCAQMLIGRMPMRGLALLASLPPEGLLFVGPRLALTDPQIWFEAYLGSVTKSRPPIVAAAHQILFSDGLPREKVERYAARMTPEAPQVLLDAHMPGPVLSAAWLGIPTLVIGGAGDRLVWSPSVIRTACYHGAEFHLAARMGHFLQLDLGADDVAQTLADWIERRFS